MDETKLTSELPERIWLSQDLYPTSRSRTWRALKLDDNDIEYVRADLATPAPQWQPISSAPSGVRGVKGTGSEFQRPLTGGGDAERLTQFTFTRHIGCRFPLPLKPQKQNRGRDENE